MAPTPSGAGRARQVDCYLGLPLPAQEDEQGGVLVVAPRWLLHAAVPQPAGSLTYELATGHPDRQAGELVFPADLTEELRARPQEHWGTLGVDLDQVASAVLACWRRGDFHGLHLPLQPGEDPRALVRPAMTLARAEVRTREYAQPLEVEALARGAYLSAGHLQQSLHRAGRCAAQRLSAPGGAGDGGMPPWVAKQVTRPVRNQEAPAPEPQLA